MTLYLLKVHLQTFISIPITQKCQILSYDSPVAYEQYGSRFNLGGVQCIIFRQRKKQDIQGVPGGRDKTSGECSLC